MSNISNLAYIHPKAQIGANVTIEPFTVVYENTVIGDDTWIGANATIMQGARIGRNCKIHPGAVIANVPQDLKFNGEETLAVIGENTVIRECATVNRGTLDKNQTIIGRDCLLMAYVHVAHDCIVADKCILSNAVQVAGHVEIGYHVTVGGTSAVHQFVKIGAHAMIGGGSLVTKDVPPYIIAARYPVDFEGVNLIGLRRRNFSNAQIIQIQEIYRLVYQSGLNTTQALEEVENTIEASEERDTVLSFIKNATRGIVKG
jgi:UDP-N-acetylglucosamine acyltransferase